MSTSDDLATIAATQAKRQYESAPEYTVPPAEWPETKASTLALVAKVAGATVTAILIGGLIVGAVLIARSRRRQAPPAAATLHAGPAGEFPDSVATVQMPEDRAEGGPSAPDV